VRSNPVLENINGVSLGELDADLPVEMQDKSNHDILAYYRDMLDSAGGSVMHPHCRVVLLGDGGVGKTFLSRRLGSGSCPDATSTGVTHGIESRTCAACSAVHH
jgi:hypothetical protein